MSADDPARTEPVAAGTTPIPVAKESAEESAPIDVEDDEPASGPLPPIDWKKNLALFLATVVSVFYTGLEWGNVPIPEGPIGLLKALPRGWPFAVPLLAILLVHEFGHFIAARLHRVDASLPYFIPLPILSPFGTMGAVIAMRGRIRSRNALLDIGASGPLAGLVIAIPVLVIGLMESKVGPMRSPSIQEGQCLLYWILKRIIHGPIPEGYDVNLTATALAGWVGLFVTMLNLIAVAQLDGGHIAYALFGPKQNRYARILHASLLLVFAWNLARFAGPVVLQRSWSKLGTAIGNSTFWLVWFALIAVIKRVGGADHPPTEPGDLSPVRKGVAALSLVMFVLLFMPTPWAAY